jgi:WD40 repeat protein
MQLRGTLTTQTGAVRCLAFAADGNTLASGGDDGQVKFWDVATNAEKPMRPPALKGPVTCLALTGNRLAWGGKESVVLLWDVGQSTAPAKLRVPVAPRTLEFAPGGASLAVVGANGSLRVWDAASKEERPTAFRQVRGVRSVAFSPDGKTLATGHEDWTVHLWDAIAGQERGVLASELWSTPFHAVTFSLDGQWLFSLGEDGSLRRR